MKSYHICKQWAELARFSLIFLHVSCVPFKDLHDHGETANTPGSGSREDKILRPLTKREAAFQFLLIPNEFYHRVVKFFFQNVSFD